MKRRARAVSLCRRWKPAKGRKRFRCVGRASVSLGDLLPESVKEYNLNLGVPAHIAQIVIGRSVQKEGRTVRVMSKAEVEGIAGQVASYFGRGATILSGKGLYAPPGSVIKEDNLVVQVVSSGGDTCSRFKKRVYAAAARAARRGEQSSTIATVQCSGGEITADFVTPSGGRDFDLPPIRER